MLDDNKGLQEKLKVLFETNQSLYAEIAIYRKLLDAEEGRPIGSSATAGGAGIQKPFTPSPRTMSIFFVKIMNICLFFLFKVLKSLRLMSNDSLLEVILHDTSKTCFILHSTHFCSQENDIFSVYKMFKMSVLPEALVHTRLFSLRVNYPEYLPIFYNFCKMIGTNNIFYL